MQASVEEVDSRGAGDGNELDDVEMAEVAAALEVVVVDDNLSQDSLNPVSYFYLYKLTLQIKWKKPPAVFDYISISSTCSNQTYSKLQPRVKFIFWLPVP